MEKQDKKAKRIEVVVEEPGDWEQLVLPKDSASDVSEGSRPAIVVDESVWKTALRRSSGLLIDVICLTLLLLTPTFFKLLTVPGFMPSYDVVWNFSGAIAKQGAPAAFGQFLLLTPVPLIYLRVMFKYFHCWHTPGEAITKLASSSGMAGWNGLALEVFYGFFQYVALISCFTAGILSTVPLIIFCPRSSFDNPALGLVSGLTMVFLLCLGMFFFLTLQYLPKSRQDPTTSFDNTCGHVVQRIGK